MTVDFEVLGELRAYRAGRPLELGSPQQRAVLALLLMHARRPLSLRQITDQMWGEDQPGSARATVRTYISRLRRVFDGTGPTDVQITWSTAGYCLTVRPEQLDLTRFEQRAAQARKAQAAGDVRGASAAWHAALSLWHGEALAGAHGDFVDTERGRLGQLRLAALEQRIALDLDLGNHSDLIAELTGLVSANPVRERLRELLMLALYRCGRQAEALSTYLEARMLLKEELGALPGPGLNAVYEQILHTAPELSAPAAPLGRTAGVESRLPGSALRPSVLGMTDIPNVTGVSGVSVARRAPAQLPADLPDFVGRRDELDWLRRVLRGGPAPAVAGLVGLGGIGKTALAVHAGHLMREEYPDGQLFVDLHGGGSPPAPFEVLGGCLRALGVVPDQLPDSVEQRGALWRSTVARRRLLLVLDDVRDARQVGELLEAGPGVSVVLTAQRRVPGLPSVAWHSMDVLPPAEAMNLFSQVAGVERVQTEPNACARLLSACSYLPSAVRVAGTRVTAKHSWSVEQIEQHWRDEVEQGLGLHEDHHVICAPIWRAVSALDAEVTSAFRVCALPEVASLCESSVAALLDVSPPNAAALLNALHEAHLLVSLPGGRFGYLAPVRAVARQAPSIRDNWSANLAALHRLGRFYLRRERVARLKARGEPGAADSPFDTPAQAEAWLAATRADRARLFEQLVTTPSSDRASAGPSGYPVAVR